MSTLKSINVQHPSSATINLVNDSSGNVAVGNNLTVTGTSTLTGNVTAAGTVAMGSSFKRNRIINGNMLIDQRNAGASVTVNSANNFYPVDRLACTGQTADGVFTVQQSTTRPTGFINSVVATVTTADSSIGATQQYVIAQFIEGFNISDLGWGAAGAQSVTVSFWVRSSITGTFGGSIVNSGFNRSYPFTYTINAANTFEYKTVTIAGDTSGTWLTDNGVGLRLIFSLGAGSTYIGTAGAWSGSYLVGVTGQTNLIGTNGATFYITGVQLEVGSVATPYERQVYSDQLAQCQRYYTKSYDVGTVPGTATVNGTIGTVATSANLAYANAPFKVSMRIAPTIVLYNPTSGATGTWTDGTSGSPAVSANTTGTNNFNVLSTVTTSNTTIYGHYTASAEL